MQRKVHGCGSFIYCCGPSFAGLTHMLCRVLQEYLPRIKDNDVLRAVENNSSGSRPKELFEEVLEDVEKQWETDRYVSFGDGGGL